MIAPGLARSQFTRPTVRAVVVVAAVAGGWFAWSPGTRFGLVGAYGGWRFASIHLLDVGLVPVLVVGALCGATPRERRIDEQLRTAGVHPARVARAVVASGALAAVGMAVAFLVGAGVGGWFRALAKSGSWWADPGASAGVVTDLGNDARLVLAVAVAGAVGALLGWIARRDDVAVALATLVSIGELPELSAALGRLPVTIDALALSPIGALRAAALGDRGLAAPGYQRVTAAVPYGIVLAAWCLVLVALALPGRVRDRRSSGERSARLARPTPSRRWVPALALLVVVTAVFGATVPGRAADALPWRWQRSWREAEQVGWSSPQTVDRYLDALRADPPRDPSELLVSPDAVGDAVISSIPRASQVERQPVAAMAGPEHVVVRLDFASPIVSGSAAFTSYLVRFTLEPDADLHWRIVAAEGPVGSAVHPADPGSGS